MPLYEYLCQDCEYPFETLVLASDEVVHCPRCHATKVERTLSLPARPLTEASASTCRSSGPPCGPICGRWPGNN